MVLIDKEKLLEELKKRIDTHEKCAKIFADTSIKETILSLVDEIMFIIEIVEVQPVVEAVPVVHGEWIYDENGNDWGLGAWICSRCGCKNDNLGMGSRINPYLFAGSRFCPNCGADMGKRVD